MSTRFWGFKSGNSSGQTGWNMGILSPIFRYIGSFIRLKLRFADRKISLLVGELAQLLLRMLQLVLHNATSVEVLWNNGFAVK